MAERPEDLNLPNAVISRIIKEALPDGVIISKEARTAISKAASVFVLYATSCANNFAMKSKRKTLTATDVLDAMDDMEFEKFIEPLKESLELYRSSHRGKKQAAVKKKIIKEAEKINDQSANNSVENNSELMEQAEESVSIEHDSSEVLENQENENSNGNDHDSSEVLENSNGNDAIDDDDDQSS